MLRAFLVWGSWPILAAFAAGPLGAEALPAPEAPQVQEKGSQAMWLKNGVIWTGDPARPWAESIRLQDGRIAAVGSDQELRGGTAAGALEIDLHGSFVCPGLIDAHAHVLSFGLNLDRVDLVGAVSLEESLGRIAGKVAEMQGSERGGWVRGRGWDQNDWPRQEFPTRQDLDGVSGDYPVVLDRIDGHAVWANTKALELAGITRSTPDPDGGKIYRDESGDPTGILVDNAERLVMTVIPEPPVETKRLALERAAVVLARAGLTGIHDMGMDAADLAVYRDLSRTEDLGVRIYAAYSASDPDLASVLAQGPDTAWTNWFRLGMIKFYLDGAMGSRGAALIEPYADDPQNRGLLVTEHDQLMTGLRDATGAGFQVAMHAIGDRGNRTALDAWEGVLAGNPAAAQGLSADEAPPAGIGDRPPVVPPVRVEHAQHIHPDDLDRFAALGVVASMQPTHCTSDMPWIPSRLGPERLFGSYAWRSLIDRGVVLVAGSDFPVESHDPRLGLYAAVTRRQPDGQPRDGWAPEERLGREEALAAFTAAPAYVSGDLRRWGTLTPGKQADLVVFDRNLVTCDPERILDARVLLTLIGGRVFWHDPAGPLDLE